MLVKPAGLNRLVPELVRSTAGPPWCGGLCMGVVCAEPGSASELDPFDE